MKRRTNCLGCDGSMQTALSEISTDYCPSCCAAIVDACHGLDADDVRKCIKAVAAIKVKSQSCHHSGCRCEGCTDARIFIDAAVESMPYRIAIEIFDEPC